MAWNTDKQSVKVILERHLSGDAPDLCMRYFEVVKSVDGVGQGVYLPPDIMLAFVDMVTGFTGNQFYEKNAHRVYPAMVHGVKSWNDAIQFLKAKPREQMSDDDKLRFHHSRMQFHEVACICASIQGKDTSLLRSELFKSEVL